MVEPRLAKLRLIKEAKEASMSVLKAKSHMKQTGGRRAEASRLYAKAQRLAGPVVKRQMTEEEKLKYGVTDVTTVEVSEDLTQPQEAVPCHLCGN